MFKRLSNKLGPLLALLLVVVLFAGLDRWKNGDKSKFFSLDNLQQLSVRATPVAVAALGMTVIIIAGGIDLSAGTAVALCATALAYCLRAGYSPVVAVAASIAAGTLAGMVNGILIAGLRVVPFIVTLGSMMIYLGVGKLIANETTIHLAPKLVPALLSRTGLVNPFPKPVWLVTNVVPNFASGVWLAVGLAAALALVLRYTVFGRYVFALGSNESTARLCGINVPLMKVAVYALSGTFVGIAGLYQFSRLSVGNPTSGIGMELRVIAAVVIGGGSLNGGRGSLLGTLAGAVMMETIQSGCTQMGWRSAYQDIVIGAIIIVAVAVDQLRQNLVRS
ncbi:MAG TPA: ABC transporter permease [Pirellulales bacterium]|nr:ABC transporter permease [Pirellulales bacterium]